MILGYKLLTEEKDKRFIKETFGTYLAPELIQEMHSTRTMPKLGGEAKIITAFFTDIQGFSTFSEKLTAYQLVELLNEYLTAMTDILIHEKGTLDKYEGDAIIAFFGAPMELVDQEVRACRVAVKMQEKLAELRKKWRDEKTASGEPDPNMRHVPPEEWVPGDRWPKIVHKMRMRIGINTGEIVVGNMGSTTRMNYTMMGDPVNLSARLEAAAKQYGVYNLVSEYTLDVGYMDETGEPRKVMDMVETRFLDHITVVGKSEPVRVYELFAMKGELSDNERQLIALFEEGMRYYQQMQWDKAIQLFGRSHKLERYAFEKTTPSEVFIKRCRDFKKNPPVGPGEKWDGVYSLSKK
jgi:adenylate cyclase